MVTEEQFRSLQKGSIFFPADIYDIMMFSPYTGINNEYAFFFLEEYLRVVPDAPKDLHRLLKLRKVRSKLERYCYRELKSKTYLPVLVKGIKYLGLKSVLAGVEYYLIERLRDNTYRFDKSEVK